MKIKEKNSNEILEVYAIYWIENEVSFLVLSAIGEGLTTLAKEVIEVVDPHLGAGFTFYKRGFYYAPIIDEKLLDDLLENDPNTCMRFAEILCLNKKI